jgi:hypothetical protein
MRWLIAARSASTRRRRLSAPGRSPSAPVPLLVDPAPALAGGDGIATPPPWSRGRPTPCPAGRVRVPAGARAVALVPLEPFDAAERARLGRYLRRLAGATGPVAVGLQAGLLVLAAPADDSAGLELLARGLGRVVMGPLLGRRDRRFAVVPDPQAGAWV